MSDNFPARIEIGGKIPARLREELANLLLQETTFSDADCSEQIEDLGDVQSALDAAIKEGSTVSFSDDQSCYGEFPDVEFFLRQNGIHFDRYNDAKYE